MRALPQWNQPAAPHTAPTTHSGGSGVFRLSDQDVGSRMLPSYAVELGDLDGDLDAFVGNDGINRVWLMDERGHFRDSQQHLGDRFTQAVGLGDLDRDGDFDAFVANACRSPNCKNRPNGRREIASQDSAAGCRILQNRVSRERIPWYRNVDLANRITGRDQDDRGRIPISRRVPHPSMTSWSGAVIDRGLESPFPSEEGPCLQRTRLGGRWVRRASPTRLRATYIRSLPGSYAALPGLIGGVTGLLVTRR